MLESAFNIIFDEPFDVRIRFSAGQARYIKERQWAREQKFIDEPDGSVVLEMKTSGRDEVKRWVLSFGSAAVVLKPAELREDVREELKLAFGAYV